MLRCTVYPNAIVHAATRRGRHRVHNTVPISAAAGTVPTDRTRWQEPTRIASRVHSAAVAVAVAVASTVRMQRVVPSPTPRPGLAACSQRPRHARHGARARRAGGACDPVDQRVGGAAATRRAAGARRGGRAGEGPVPAVR